jgi:sugar lactone lactonase YvrE
MNDKPETLLDGLSVPEGPRWHDGKLWFSDMWFHCIRVVDLSGQSEIVAELADRPSGLGWTKENQLLAVSMIDRRVLRVQRGELHLFADLSTLSTGACNDMVVGGTGQAWVGNMGYDFFGGAERRPGTILHVSASGSCSLAADGLEFPNGMVITPDGGQLIVAESFGNRLTAFDIEPDGILTNRRVFARCDDVVPDGICLDAEGAIWVADPRTNRAIRILKGGKVAQTVRVAEDRHVYACALGGAERRALFMCTRGSVGGAASREAKQGRIEIIQVDVPGVGWP